MRSSTYVRSSLPVAAAALTLAALSASAGTPPPAFAETVVIAAGPAGVTSPTAVAYEPGTGNAWVTEKGPGLASGTALIRVKDVGTGVVGTALTLTVDSRGERGVLGLAFDPDYLDSAATRHVYVYYTAPSPAPHNRVSRFLELGGVLGGEEVLLEGPDLNAATNHNGGCLRFAPDKTLYVSMGDNDTDADPAPLSRNLMDLRGKILRINRDGTIPADNPYFGSLSVRNEIYEWGLRNPWRFTFDLEPSGDTLYIADVGEVTWENVYRGVAGADHGYPCFEGFAPFRACSGALPPGSVTFPIYTYGHGNQTSPVQGNSITGGPVYRAAAFPAEYQGNYFFADYGMAAEATIWIRRARIAPDGRLTDVEMFVPDAPGVVDMAVSPAGCLTYVSITGDGVRDVCYVGGANGQPRAVATAVPQAGQRPLLVQFTGSGSTDPDMEPLTYAWDFGDAGSDTAPDPTHLYGTFGVYQAVLTVDDGRGAPNSTDATAPIRIVVGNRPPRATILSPPDMTRYRAGDTIDFAGTGLDPEDGALSSGSMSWTIEFHHDLHVHPFLGPIMGLSSGSFAIPTSGEDATNVFYRIWLSVTDSGAPLGPEGALTATTHVDVVPIVSSITLATDPPGVGLQLEYEWSVVAPPFSAPSIAGFPRTIAAPPVQVIGSETWQLAGWSDGGAAEHGIATPDTDTTYTATYACIIGCPEAGHCADGVDNDGDGPTDCVDTDCTGDASCLEAGHCADGSDNDVDGFTDCADADCVADPTCATSDTDGDTVLNDMDCAPLDAALHRIPDLVPWLDVAKDPLAGPDGVTLTWSDPGTFATAYDVASDLVRGGMWLRRGADAPCVARDVVGWSSGDATPVAADALYYLLRGTNACGAGPWGTDSRGNARPTCP